MEWMQAWMCRGSAVYRKVWLTDIAIVFDRAFLSKSWFLPQKFASTITLAQCKLSQRLVAFSFVTAWRGRSDSCCAIRDRGRRAPKSFFASHDHLHDDRKRKLSITTSSGMHPSALFTRQCRH
jgi:hypothetical protein